MTPKEGEIRPIENLAAFHPRNPDLLARTLPDLERLRSWLLLNPFTGMKEIENLRQADELSLGGKRALICPNHLSHVDHFFLWFFSRSYDEDKRKNNSAGVELEKFWDRLAIIARESLFKEELFDDFLPLADIIGVVTPHDIKKLRAARDKEGIRWANQLNKQSRIEVEKAFERGKTIVLYPEAKRSETGTLIEIDPSIASLLKMADYVVPAGFTGTNTFSPYGQEEKFLNGLRKIMESSKTGDIFRFIQELISSRKILPSLLAPVTLTFGAPYQVAKEKDNEALVTELGSKIAELLPPQSRGFYGVKGGQKPPTPSNFSIY